MSENQQQAGHEKAAVEVDCDAQADDNGQRHDQHPNSNISQGQGDNEIEGGGLKAGVQLDHPDDQHVAHYGAEPNDNLHGDVGNVGQQQSGVVDKHLSSQRSLPGDRRECSSCQSSECSSKQSETHSSLISSLLQWRALLQDLPSLQRAHHRTVTSSPSAGHISPGP